MITTLIDAQISSVTGGKCDKSIIWLIFGIAFNTTGIILAILSNKQRNCTGEECKEATTSKKQKDEHDGWVCFCQRNHGHS